jgi:hypothetical protein
MFEYTLPDDYETCDDCGYDHSYEYTHAAKWHQDNPCSYCDCKDSAHEITCPTLHISK